MKITACRTLSIYVSICEELVGVGLMVCKLRQSQQSRPDFLISTLIHFFKCVVLVDHIHGLYSGLAPPPLGLPKEAQYILLSSHLCLIFSAQLS